MRKENKFLKNQQYNDESSSEKIPSENNDDDGKLLKINNFTGTATNRLEKKLFPKEYISILNDEIVIESNSQTFVGINNNVNNYTVNTTKLEITNKSIFFTPSTICNYYQHSENEGSPNDRNNYIFINNKFQDLLMNESSNAKKHENEQSSSKSQIKYTKTQLQSGEKNVNNFNNNTVQKAGQNFVGNMQELVKEIKKELVLNISTLEDDYTFEEEKAKNAFNEENIRKTKGIENNFTSKFACSNEIYIEIKPLQTVKNMKKEILFSKKIEPSIQMQPNINFSIYSSNEIKNKSSHNSLSKNKNLLTKTKSKPENAILNSYKKIQNLSILQYKKKDSVNLNQISKFYSEIPKSIHKNVKKISRNELPIKSAKNELSLERNKLTSNHCSLLKINNQNKETELLNPIIEIPLQIQASIKCKNDQNKIISNAVNSKKKEYFDLIKIMFSGKTQRNKNHTMDEKSHSLNRKTVEVTIDLDQNSRNISSSKQSKKPLKISTSLAKNSIRIDILKCANSTRNNSGIKICDENALNLKKSNKNTNLIPLTVKSKNSIKVLHDKKFINRDLPPTNLNADKVFVKKSRLCEQYNYKTAEIICKNDDKIKIVEDYTVISNFSKYKKVLVNAENKENCNILANQSKKPSNNSSKIIISCGDEDNPLLTE